MAKEKDEGDAVTVSTSLEQTDSDASKVSKKRLSARVLAQRARREREREVSCESVKKQKTATSTSAQETPHKLPPDVTLACGQTNTEKDEPLPKEKDVKSTVEKTDMDKTVDTSAEKGASLLKRVLAQRARRQREKKELELKKSSQSSSALENTVNSDQTKQDLPFSPTLINGSSSEKDELLAKEKDHPSCEVIRTVEKIDTDKTVETSAEKDASLLKRVLAQRARREREKKELELKKPSQSSSALKNTVTSDQTKQDLPFSPTLINGSSAIPDSPSPSHCDPQVKNPVIRQQLNSSEPNQRPSSLDPWRLFTMRQPPIRVHHFITTKNQINMNRNPLQSFDTSSVMRHIRMMHVMSGIKRKNPETEASKCKVDMGKCRMDPPPKPEIRPDVPICLQPHSGNLPPLSTAQSNLREKQSKPEHPSISTLGDKVAAAIRKSLSLTKSQISQRRRRERERERAEATRPSRPVRYTKQSIAQRARRNRERQQAAKASSATRSSPVEEQSRSTEKRSSSPPQSLVSQGSDLHILPPQKGLSNELGASIPAEHITSAVCVDSPPPSPVSMRTRGARERLAVQSSGPVLFSKRSMAQRARKVRQRQQAVLASSSTCSFPEEEKTNSTKKQFEEMVSQGSDFPIFPPNKDASGVLGSSIPAEYLTSAVCVDSSSRSSVSLSSSLHSLPPDKGVSTEAGSSEPAEQLGSSILAEHLTSAVCVDSPPRNSVSLGSNLHSLPPNKGVSSELGSSKPAEYLTSAVCGNSPPQCSVSEGTNLHIIPPNKGVSSELGSSKPAEHLTSAVCGNSPLQCSVSEGTNLHILPPNKGVSSESRSSLPAEHLTRAVRENSGTQRSVLLGFKRATVIVRPSRRSLGQRARRERQRQQAAIAASSTCSLTTKKQGNSTRKRSEKGVLRGGNLHIPIPVLQGSLLHIPPPNKGMSMPPEHRTSGLSVNSPPQSAVSQGRNSHILPPNKGMSMPAKHHTSAVCVNSPPWSSVSRGNVLHFLPPNKDRCSELGSSIPEEHLTSAVFVNSPTRCLAGGSTASIVHSGPGPDNLVSGDASSLVNISSLGKSEAARLSSPSVGFGKPFDSGSKTENVSSQSSSVRTSSSTAYPSSSSYGPASTAPDMTKKTLGTDGSKGTGIVLWPQLAKSCKMRVYTGEQWRLGGSSFKVPKELSVGAATAVIRSRGSKALPTQAQDKIYPNRVQEKVLLDSSFQIFAANNGVCSASGSSVPAEHMPDADIVNFPAWSSSGGPNASSSQGPDNLTSDDASNLLNVCSLQRADLMRVSSRNMSGSIVLGKGIDSSCKFESVACQSRNMTCPSSNGTSSAASDMLKKTLGTDQSGTGAITQPPLSTLSNRILLPQLGVPSKATGLIGSNSDGEQWRPGGRSFQDPAELVQQSIDSTLDVYGEARSDKCLTGHNEEDPEKSALSDLNKVNLIVVPSSPQNSVLDNSCTVADTTMVSAINLSVNGRSQSPTSIQVPHVEDEHLICTSKISGEELQKSNEKTDCAKQDQWEQPSPLRQAQTDKTYEASFSRPMKSLTESLSAQINRENTSSVSRLDEEYWKARFLRLQNRLRRCDDTSDEEYIQRIQCSFSNTGGRHALEVKGRAMKLLLEEGIELMRVKHLNVLGNSVIPSTEPLETEN